MVWFELLLFIPVVCQIAAASLLQAHTANYLQVAYMSTVAAFHIPSFAFIIVSRLVYGVVDMKAETLAISSFVANLVFYLSFQLRYEFTIWHWAAFVAFLMHELTYEGSNWFAHRAVLAVCAFTIAKMFLWISFAKYERFSKLGWKITIWAELAVLLMIGLMNIMETSRIDWFIFVYTIFVPHVFPLCNATRVPETTLVFGRPVVPKMWISIEAPKNVTLKVQDEDVFGLFGETDSQAQVEPSGETVLLF